MPGGRVMSSYSCWAAAAACKCHAAPRCCCCRVPQFWHWYFRNANTILLLQLSHFKNLCQPGTADLNIHFFSVSKLGSGRSNQILKWETVQGVSLPAFYPNCTPKESHSSSIPKVIQNRVTLVVSGPINRVIFSWATDHLLHSTNHENPRRHRGYTLHLAPSSVTISHCLRRWIFTSFSD